MKNLFLNVRVAGEDHERGGRSLEVGERIMEGKGKTSWRHKSDQEGGMGHGI